MQSLAVVAVHISCRNGGRGFALRIIAIVQVRTVHVLTFFNFILFQHRKETLKRERSGLNLSIEKTLKQGKTGSQAKTTGKVNGEQLRQCTREEANVLNLASEDPKNKGRKRKICVSCRSRLHAEVKCQKLDVRFTPSFVHIQFMPF